MRRTRRMFLAALAVLVAVAIASPVAQAGDTYGRVGSFGAEELGNPVGVAVNATNGDVYVASLLFTGAKEYGASGGLLAGFGEGGFRSGVAVDPVNGNVYLVNGEAQTNAT